MNIKALRKPLTIALKLTSAFCLVALFSISLVAQEAAAPTAAGVYNKALAAMKAKNYLEAFPMMEQALQLATESENEKVIGLAKTNGAIAAYNVGKAKIKSKDWAGANEAFNKGIAMSDKYSSNHIGLARVLKGQGKYKEAMDAFFVGVDKAKAENKAKKAADAEKRAKSIVTSVYKAKKYADVVSLGEQFLAKAKNPDVSYYVGKSMIANGNDEGALAHLDAALNGIKDADKVNYAKAQTLEKLGRNADAVAAYKLVAGEKYKAQVAHKVSTLK